MEHMFFLRNLKQIFNLLIPRLHNKLTKIPYHIFLAVFFNVTLDKK